MGGVAGVAETDTEGVGCGRGVDGSSCALRLRRILALGFSCLSVSVEARPPSSFLLVLFFLTFLGGVTFSSTVPERAEVVVSAYAVVDVDETVVDFAHGTNSLGVSVVDVKVADETLVAVAVVVLLLVLIAAVVVLVLALVLNVAVVELMQVLPLTVVLMQVLVLIAAVVLHVLVLVLMLALVLVQLLVAVVVLMLVLVLVMVLVSM